MLQLRSRSHFCYTGCFGTNLYHQYSIHHRRLLKRRSDDDILFLDEDFCLRGHRSERANSTGQKEIFPLSLWLSAVLLQTLPLQFSPRWRVIVNPSPLFTFRPPWQGRIGSLRDTCCEARLLHILPHACNITSYCKQIPPDQRSGLARSTIFVCGELAMSDTVANSSPLFAADPPMARSHPNVDPVVAHSTLRTHTHHTLTHGHSALTHLDSICNRRDVQQFERNL
jgi:hypothetical protein